MNRALVKNLFKSNSHLPSSSSFSIGSIYSQNRSFSSPKINSTVTQNQDDVTADADDVSTQDLKKLIDKCGEGDANVIPFIFEAILKRKLAKLQRNGADTHDESDDEFMEEIRKRPINSSVVEEEHGSDSEELEKTDDELSE